MEAEGDNNFVRFTYTGEGEIPNEATHVFITVRIVPAAAFMHHPNIVEVICGEGVEKIEEEAFWECPSLRRVNMPGVKIVERGAFGWCEALEDIECDKLEIIGEEAFQWSTSLRSINLPSARIVEADAFSQCKDLVNVKFGGMLERICRGVFRFCQSLERITIPLKGGVIASDYAFMGCEKLKDIDLVEGALLRETIAALHLEGWRNDMNEINSINQILLNAYAGGRCAGGKAELIRRWIRSILGKVVHNKAEHRRVLREAETTLQLALHRDIVKSNVLPFAFLELPSHTFEGEVLEDEDEPSAAATPTLELASPQDIVNMEEQVNLALSLVIGIEEKVDQIKEKNNQIEEKVNRIEEMVNHQIFFDPLIAIVIVSIFILMVMGAIILEVKASSERIMRLIEQNQNEL